MSVTQAFVGLAAQIVPGLIAGRLRIFADVEQAVSVLNTYALRMAFPALIVVNLLDPSFRWPNELGFWLVVPLSLSMFLALVAALRRVPRWSSHGGTIAMTGIFGNVAYIGLPLGHAVLGESSRGPLTLMVAMHVVVTLALGPVALARWSGGGDSSWTVRRLLRQPIVLSPVVGLGLRLTPEIVIDTTRLLLTPLGRSAGPVVLFMIGLYIYDQARALGRVDAVAIGHVAGKVVVLPLLTGWTCWMLQALGLMSSDVAAMAVLLSSMPTAAATFSLAQEMKIGESRIAQAVVASTLVTAVTLPLVAWWVGAAL